MLSCGLILAIQLVLESTWQESIHEILALLSSFLIRMLQLIMQNCSVSEVFFSLLLEPRTRIGPKMVYLSKCFIHNFLFPVELRSALLWQLILTHARRSVFFLRALDLSNIFVWTFVWALVWRLISDNLAVVLNQWLEQSTFKWLGFWWDGNSNSSECWNLGIFDVIIPRNWLNILTLHELGIAYWSTLIEILWHKLGFIWTILCW